MSMTAARFLAERSRGELRMSSLRPVCLSYPWQKMSKLGHRVPGSKPAQGAAGARMLLGVQTLCRLGARQKRQILWL